MSNRIAGPVSFAGLIVLNVCGMLESIATGGWAWFYAHLLAYGLLCALGGFAVIDHWNKRQSSKRRISTGPGP